MIAKQELIAWLNSIDADEVGIDEGGMNLVVEGREDEVYIEVGGVPTEEDREADAAFLTTFWSTKVP